ncbi:MAG TPA: transcription antitermination factor NusB [Burkholderiales bacterium]|nr:transcription antitermination factor NusB [Burkholderiales bacterium]
MASVEEDPRPHGASRGSRRRSREFALQALYQWLLARTEPAALVAQAAEKSDYARADRAYVETLINGVIARAAELEAALQPFLDRPVGQLSPIEHALLLIGAFELTVSLDVPYRVAINEAVELAKVYGGTDGHRYVNGVLDKLAAQVRPLEVRK